MTYSPNIYVIEESQNGLGYHQYVSVTRWYAVAVISFPLRFFPLFKPYKYVSQKSRVLKFRGRSELNFLNK